MAGPGQWASADLAWLRLLAYLEARDYQFVSPTPATHGLVRSRPSHPELPDLRDLFGWMRSFRGDAVEPELLDLMDKAGTLERLEPLEGEGVVFRSRYRVSSLDGRLYIHSAPTSDASAVFLGPDSYRYSRFLRQVLARDGAGQALDIGTGAGVGAHTVLGACPGSRVTGSDINPAALRLARINSAHNGLAVELVESDGLPDDGETFDVISANPPYVAGPVERVYRDGGGNRGEGLSLAWASAGLERLRSGGRFILYTGSAIVAGRDAMREALAGLAERKGCRLDYEEIDPDVFGGTLRSTAYAEVERIAAVGAVLTRS